MTTPTERRHRRRTTRIAAAMLLSATVVTGALAAVTSGSSGAATKQPVTGNFIAGFWQSWSAPATAPPGINVPGCKPSPQHPRPVILINGTFANMTDSWSGLGPTLANDGYCVYSAAIGGNPNDVGQTVGPVIDSVLQIKSLIDTVRATTGAGKVDLVGWSQGALIAEYYVKFLGGANNVDKLVGIAPSWHGLSAPGILALAYGFPLIGLQMQGNCVACGDQMTGSPLINKVNEGPIVQPGVHYTVIASLVDQVVTPGMSAFVNEPGVDNQLVQASCLLDLSDHFSLPYDPVVWKLVRNALDPAHATWFYC